MFGYYRFFLASLVLFSHVGESLQGFNLGVWGVVSFYMLAGFVACNLTLKIFSPGKSFLTRFYIERALRIFPQYLYVIILTVLFISITDFGEAEFTFIKSINNIVVVPLNYYMLIDNYILLNPKECLIPPAWSLGTELQAYLILPFIVRYKSIKIILSILSFFIFAAASIGIVHTDYFGYRLLPGVLFIFILGTIAYKSTNAKDQLDIFDKYFPPIVYGTLLLLLISIGLGGELNVPFVRETSLGVLIGFPIITHLSNSNINVRFNRFFGDISYGLFLSHFLGMWLIGYSSFISKSDNKFLYIIGVFIISLVVSVPGVFIIESRFKKIRYRLSRK